MKIENLDIFKQIIVDFYKNLISYFNCIFY